MIKEIFVIIVCATVLISSVINASPVLISPLIGKLNDYRSVNKTDGSIVFKSTSLIETFTWAVDEQFHSVLSSTRENTQYICYNQSLSASYTKSIYIQPTEFNAHSVLIGSGDHSLSLLNNRIGCNQGISEQWIMSNTLLPLNTWTHVVCTYDSVTNRNSIYLNGSLDSTNIATNISFIGSQFTSMMIGHNPISDESNVGFVGKLCHLYIVDYSMSDMDVKQLHFMLSPDRTSLRPVGFLPLVSDLMDVITGRVAAHVIATKQQSYQLITFPMSNTGPASNHPDRFGYSNIFPINSVIGKDHSACFWVATHIAYDYGLTTPIFSAINVYASDFFVFGIFGNGTLIIGQVPLVNKENRFTIFRYQLNYQIPNYQTGQSVHVCGTYNHLTSMAYIYVNGELKNHTNLRDDYPGGATVQLGAVENLSNGFVGYIRCLAWWDTVITMKQIQSIYKSQIRGGCAGIIADYPTTIHMIAPISKFYTQDFGQTVPSTSGFTWLEEDNTDTIIEKRLHRGLVKLNGTNSYIDMTNRNTIYTYGSKLIGNIGGVGTGDFESGTAGWTFEAVVKRIRTLGLWGRIMNFGVPNAPHAYSIAITDNPSYPKSFIGSMVYENREDPNLQQFYARTDKDLVDNEWTHVVFTIKFNSNDQTCAQTIYRNGVLAGENPFSARCPTFTTRTGHLGKSPYPADGNFYAYYDQFNVYSQCLNQTQVQYLYTNAMQIQQTTNPPTASGVKITQFTTTVPFPWFANPGPLVISSTSIVTIQWNDTPNIQSWQVTMTDSNGTIFRINTTLSSHTFVNAREFHQYTFTVEQLGDGIRYSPVYSDPIYSDTVYLGTPPQTINANFAQDSIGGISIQIGGDGIGKVEIRYYDVQSRSTVFIDTTTSMNYYINPGILSLGRTYMILLYCFGDSYHYISSKHQIVSSNNMMLSAPPIPQSVLLVQTNNLISVSFVNINGATVQIQYYDTATPSLTHQITQMSGNTASFPITINRSYVVDVIYQGDGYQYQNITSPVFTSETMYIGTPVVSNPSFVQFNNGSVQISWTNIIGISKYSLRYVDMNVPNSVVHLDSITSPYLINSLQSGHTYQFSLSQTGNGYQYANTESALHTSQSMYLGNAPVVSDVSWQIFTNNTIKISWVDIDGVMQVNARYHDLTSNEHSASFILNSNPYYHDLNQNHQYMFEITQLGTGYVYNSLPSSPLLFGSFFMNAPPEVRDLNITIIGMESIFVEWNYIHGVQSTKIIVTDITNNFEFDLLTTDNNITITSLDNSHVYVIQVASLGNGITYHNVLSQYIGSHEINMNGPPIITNIQSKNNFDGSVELFWDSLLGTTTNISYFNVNTSSIIYELITQLSDQYFFIAPGVLTIGQTYQFVLHRYGDGITYPTISSLGVTTLPVTLSSPPIVSDWRFTHDYVSKNILFDYTRIEGISTIGFIVNDLNLNTIMFLNTTSTGRYMFESLTPNHSYMISVLQYGDGSMYPLMKSDPITSDVMFLGKPDMIQNLTVTQSTDGTLSFEWSNINGISYFLLSTNDPLINIVNTTSNRTVFTNLVEQQLYSFELIQIGDGYHYPNIASSSLFYGPVIIGKPPKITNIATTTFANGSILLTWSYFPGIMTTEIAYNNLNTFDKGLILVSNSQIRSYLFHSSITGHTYNFTLQQIGDGTHSAPMIKSEAAFTENVLSGLYNVPFCNYNGPLSNASMSRHTNRLDEANGFYNI